MLKEPLVFHIMHGRLSPNTGGTDLDGKEVDDWGFEGPELPGVVGIDYTYGTHALCFVDDAAKDRALALTGWTEGVRECSLEIDYEDDCLRLWNAERQRHEYFGDWALGDWSLQQ